MLALSVALVAPYFINWTNYRADFEREASRILGREVTVEGRADARLLPFPSVTFSDVRVAGESPDMPAMTVETFSMDAELAPYMRGEIHIFDMRLVRPRAILSLSDDGRVDWATRPGMGIGAGQISLEKVTVVDGEITLLHGASGRSHRLSGLQAELSARTLAGPWRIAGTTAIDGSQAAFTVSTGTVDENGAVRLRVRVLPQDVPVAVESDGQFMLAGAAPSYVGSFRLDAGLPPAVNPEMAAGNQPRTVADYRVVGRFDLGHDALKIEEFRLETGPVEDPYTADGTARLEFGDEPRFSVSADGAQVRFDAATDQAGVGSGITLDRRLAVLRQFLAGLPRPAIPGEVDLELPAVVVGDTTIRTVSLKARPSERGWSLDRLSAVLPGRSTLEAQGEIATGEDFGFEGRLLLAVAQPSGFAAWIAHDVDEAIRRLPSAGFEGRVQLTETVQKVSEMELILGATRFRGAVERRQPETARPSIRFALDGGALDVEGLTAFGAMFLSDGGERRLADHDLDLVVVAGPVSGSGVDADSLDAVLRLREGQIEIDRLAIGGLAGASVSATGTVRNYPARPTGKIDASIVGVDLAPLTTLLAGRFLGLRPLVMLERNAAANPGLLEDARVDIVASAAEQGNGISVAVSATGEAGGTRFTLAGSTDDATIDVDRWPALLSASAANEDASRLYALFGLPALPMGFTGPLDVSIDAEGVYRDGLRSRLQLTGEGLAGSFHGTLRGSDTGLTAEGAVRLDTPDIEPWLMTAGVSLPGMGLGTPVRLTADLGYTGESLSLARLQGSLAGSATQGDLAVTMRDGLPHLRGRLTTEAADALSLAALVLGEPALASDDGELPTQPFQSEPTALLTAELDLGIARLRLVDDTVDGARLRLALERGGATLDIAEGGYRGGRLTGLVDLKNTAGTGLLSAQLRIAGADLDRFAVLSGLSGKADVAASITADGKSVDAMAAALAGSGTISLAELTIEGLHPDPMPLLLAEADRIGRDVNASAVANFAPDIVTDGEFGPTGGDLAFTVAAGQLRAPPLRLETPRAILTADLRADLSARTVAIAGDVAYSAEDEEVAGAEPGIRFVLEGPIEAPVRTLDTAPLAQFLTQRALEKEQARVEAMQAVLIERQRLRREVRYYNELEAERIRVEEERRAAEEARLRAEEEARRAAEEAERLRREEEARRQAEDEARRRAEQPPVSETQPANPPPPTIERAPLPSPRVEGRADPAVAPPAASEGRSMFEVFRSDGTSIDAILKSLEESR